MLSKNASDSCAPVQDFDSRCVRAAWTSLLPTAVVLLVLVYKVPLPRPLSRFFAALKSPFEHFLTLPEAEQLLYAQASDSDDASPAVNLSLWRTVVLSMLSLLEAIAWAGFGAEHLVVAHHADDLKSFTTWSPFLIALSWLYSSLRLILRPQPTPSYDLFTLWLIHFIGALLTVGTVLYDKAAYETPFPGNGPMFVLVANLVATAFLVINMLSLPIAIPSKYIDASKIVRNPRCVVVRPVDNDTRERKSLLKTTAHCGAGCRSAGSDL